MAGWVEIDAGSKFRFKEPKGEVEMTETQSGSSIKGAAKGIRIRKMSIFASLLLGMMLVGATRPQAHPPDDRAVEIVANVDASKLESVYWAGSDQISCAPGLPKTRHVRDL
jgi:hypothetical protein